MMPTARPFAWLTAASAVLMLAACASTVDAPPMSDPHPPMPTQCNAAAAQSYVGQQASAQVVEKARQQAGAEVARVIPPDTAVTMEYREGRLNVYTDATNTITRIACG